MGWGRRSREGGTTEMEQQAAREAQADWLVQTKLHPPRLREDVVPRPRLVEALRQALTTHPLTLLSAPAGYGKTTLLAQAILDFGFWIPDQIASHPKSNPSKI